MICNCYGVGRCAEGAACDDPMCVKAGHPGVAPGPNPRHRPDCLVAQAMKYRCPECKSRRRDDVIRHTRLCELKEYQP